MARATRSTVCAALPAGRGVSLAGFAKEHVVRSGIPCWACGIPEAAEMAAEYRAGVRVTVIQSWLVSHADGDPGYPTTQATHARVYAHLRNHVPRE